MCASKAYAQTDKVNKNLNKNQGTVLLVSVNIVYIDEAVPQTLHGDFIKNVAFKNKPCLRQVVGWSH